MNLWGMCLKSVRQRSKSSYGSWCRAVDALVGKVLSQFIRSLSEPSLSAHYIPGTVTSARAV